MENKFHIPAPSLRGCKAFSRSNPIFHFLLLTLFTILLSSCASHVSRPDGPPNFYVDETKVPNAKPKKEQLSKYGNMPIYDVFGKRYYTMKSSRNFEQVGMASWYGTKFHSRLTSSGERYNMLAMTAAHKTLPLPTYVEVTNLYNKRRVIVKVNDRGPFSSARILDLSYVAAKKLGMAGRGTALVKIKAIDPDTYGKPFTFVKKAIKRWYTKNHVQVFYLHTGTFKNKLNAFQLKQRLINLLGAPVKIASASTQQHLYRIQIGPVKDLATANKISHRLRKLGIAVIQKNRIIQLNKLD